MYIDRDTLGIDSLIIHRIRAFCPEPSMLHKLQERCEQDQTTHKAQNSSSFTTHELYKRPLFDFRRRKWIVPQPGFTPSLSIGRSVAAVWDESSGRATLARLLRQGIGILTVASAVNKESQLVE